MEQATPKRALSSSSFDDGITVGRRQAVLLPLRHTLRAPHCPLAGPRPCPWLFSAPQDKDRTWMVNDSTPTFFHTYNTDENLPFEAPPGPCSFEQWRHLSPPERPRSGPGPDNGGAARDGAFYPPREHPCGGCATATQGAASVWNQSNQGDHHSNMNVRDIFCLQAPSSLNTRAGEPFLFPGSNSANL